MLFPENPSYAYMIDLTGSGSDEDNQTYLKYYADEEHRRQWAHDWPDDPLPEHEDPPFDRDAQSYPRSPIGRGARVIPETDTIILRFLPLCHAP